jgi:hypothetical protein
LIVRGGYYSLVLFIFVATCLSVVPAALSFAQFPDTPDQVGAWTGGAPVVYSGRGLTKYIDGAAEVYFAYNFRSVVSRTYTAPPPEQPITLDIFDMGGSYDAYGVFTFERQEVTAGLGQGSEYAAGLLRFWKSNLFVSVYTPAETLASHDAIFALGKAVSAAITDRGPEPTLISALPRGNLRSRSIRYFHNFAQLNYQYQLSTRNILELGSATNCVLGTYDYGASPSHALVISYPSPRAADNAYWSFLRGYSPHGLPNEFAIAGRGWLAVHVQGNMVYVLLDFPDPTTLERAMDVSDLRVWRQLH